MVPGRVTLLMMQGKRENFSHAQNMEKSDYSQNLLSVVTYNYIMLFHYRIIEQVKTAD